MVDASQGVEAQTLANTYLALHHNLEIIPVINKIDLPVGGAGRIKEQIEHVIGLDAKDAVWPAPSRVSASTRRWKPSCSGPAAEGIAGRPAAGADFRFLVRPLPRRDHAGARGRRPPPGRDQDPAVVERAGATKWRVWATSRPSRFPCDELAAGEVGFMFANIKTFPTRKIGDTIIGRHEGRVEPLPGFEESSRWCSPDFIRWSRTSTGAARRAGEAVDSTTARFNFEPENSVALGFGFRCGFLGLLHLEIVQERLEREFDIDLITTAPGVRYRVTRLDGNVIEVDNPTSSPTRPRSTKSRSRS